jgi:hypothetical protein
MTAGGFFARIGGEFSMNVAPLGGDERGGGHAETGECVVTTTCSKPEAARTGPFRWSDFLVSVCGGGSGRAVDVVRAGAAEIAGRS